MAGPGACVPGAAATRPGEAALEFGRHRLMGAVAGHRHDHVRRPVVRVEEGPDVVPADARHRLRGAQGVAPERVAGKQRGLPALPGQVGRLVGVHQDFVEDDVALGLHVRGTQGRLPHDVAQDVQTQREVLGEQAHVEGRVLLRRERVAVPAHLVQGFCDGRGRAPFRSLEEQVLEEV